MRAVGVIVGTGRDQLDGIGAEDRQLADVALPLGQVPGVVRVGLGTIAELMTAERILGCRGQVEPLRQRHLARAHAQRAQEPADAEEHPAGIVADDQHRRRAPRPVHGADLEALPGFAARRRGRDVLAERAGVRAQQSGRPDRDDRHRAARQPQRDLPLDSPPAPAPPRPGAAPPCSPDRIARPARRPRRGSGRAPRRRPGLGPRESDKAGVSDSPTASDLVGYIICRSGFPA